MPLSLSLDLLDRCVSVLQLRALAALAALAHGILDMSDDEMLVCSRRCWQLVADKLGGFEETKTWAKQCECQGQRLSLRPTVKQGPSQATLNVGRRDLGLPNCPVRSSGVDEVAVSTTGSGVYSGMRRMAGTEWTYRHSDLPRASLNC